MAHLNRRYVRGIELVRRGVIAGEFQTDIRISKTDSDLVPVVVIDDMFPEPPGVAVKLILLVNFPGDIVAAIRCRSDECEDDEEQEKADEDGHDAEVKREEGFSVAVGASKASEGNKEDKETEDEDWPAEEADALIVRLGGEPNPSSYDGGGAEDGYEVEDGC